MKHTAAARILCAVLVLLCCLFCICSCTADPGEDAASVSADPAMTLPAFDSVRSMISGYSIVRPDVSGDGAKDAMTLLRNAMGEHAGVPATDWVNERGGETVPQNNREILLGDTNRASSVAAAAALRSARDNHDLDFSITFYEGEVVIAGGSEEALPAAAQYFIDNILMLPTTEFAYGETVTVQYAYPLETVCGKSPASLKISAPAAALNPFAQQLQTALKNATGYLLPIEENASGNAIVLSVDAAMDAKKFQISVEGDSIIMKAGSTHTLSSAAEALAAGAAADGTTYEGLYTGTAPLSPGDFVLSGYRDALSAALTAAGRDGTITANGSEEGFDAIVVSDMAPAAYTVNVTDTAITVRAGHYLALEAAIREILSGKALDGVSFSGIYDGDVPLTDGDMVLVWNDEFDTETLDSTKWALKAKMSQADIKNGTDERNVTVADGKLLMRSWREENPEVPYSTNTSVTTDGTMSFRYGYLEIYANVPFMRGAWPSFWTQSKDIHRTVSYMTEIDIFEIFASRNTVTSQLHKWDFSTGEHCQLGVGGRDYFFRDNLETLNDEYHRYGFGWTPTEMYFTVDGERYFSYDITEAGNFGGFGTMQGFQDPLFVIFNNFLFTAGSSWLPDGTDVLDSTEFPIEYSIEWIRLYQKPGEGDIFYDAYNE